MTVVEVIILLLIAAICGGIGQALAGYSLGGFIVSIVVGFIGAMIGRWLQREVNLPEPLSVQIGDTNYPILWSIIGAMLFTIIIGILTRRRVRS